MKIMVAGQKSFGAAVYKRLAEDGHDVPCVWAPDYVDALGMAAIENNAGVFTRPDSVESILRRYDFDLIVNAHGHHLIKSTMRMHAKYGAIGYHPSLLPRHRGRDSVQWTIAHGDPVTGGTVYQLDDGLDTGPIIKQDWCFVGKNWDASTLWRKLFPMGVRLLADVVNNPAWPIEPRALTHQREEFATYEPHFDSLTR